MTREAGRSQSTLQSLSTKYESEKTENDRLKGDLEVQTLLCRQRLERMLQYERNWAMANQRIASLEESEHHQRGIVKHISEAAVQIAGEQEADRRHIILETLVLHHMEQRDSQDLDEPGPAAH
jgi:hypothetical protein